jgi:hypothetical protein
MPLARGARTGLTVLAVSLLALMLELVPHALAKGPSAPPALTPGRLAFVTSSEAQPESQVWTARSDGSEREQMGPGDQPLLSPSGALIAAGLFGTGAGSERGPSLAVYSTAGATPLRLGNVASATVTPLAWSPDSRYLAVSLQSTAVKNVARHSGLGLLDTTSGTLTTIASGIIYGASFAPDGSERIVFGRSATQGFSAPVNLYTALPSGAGLRRITSDGRSLNPVWGAARIAYDRERMRRNDAPVYEIWLRPPGSGPPRRLTGIRVRSLVSGLVPLGFSGSGTRLLAEFVGQDTSEAWTVSLPSGRARPVRVARRPVVGAGVSRDGGRLLVFEGGVEGPAAGDNVVTVPFGGGPAKLLVAHAAEPSWNE